MAPKKKTLKQKQADCKAKGGTWKAKQKRCYGASKPAAAKPAAAKPAAAGNKDCSAGNPGHYGTVRGGTTVTNGGKTVTFKRRDGTTAVINRTKSGAPVKHTLAGGKARIASAKGKNGKPLPAALKAQAMKLLTCGTKLKKHKPGTCKAGYETLGKTGVKCYKKCGADEYRHSGKHTCRKTALKGLRRDKHGGAIQPCPEGSSRNRETGHCRKNGGGGKRPPCKDGKTRRKDKNGNTRCMKKKSAAAGGAAPAARKKRPCKDGKTRRKDKNGNMRCMAKKSA